MTRMKPLFHTVRANKVGLWLGRVLPHWAGYTLTDTVARLIVLPQRSRTVRTILANQRVIQPNLTVRDLKDIPFRTMKTFGRSLYDYYHIYDHPEKVEALVEVSPAVETLLQNQGKDGRGLVMVMPHTPGFDLAGMRLIRLGLQVFVLSVPDPAGAYQWQNHLRQGYGMDIQPFSPQAIQTARQYLQAGKAVLTGVDRPNPDGTYEPRFFGRPAKLPVAHIRLALRTNSPVCVIGCLAKPGGGYLVDCTAPIEMLPHPDLHTEIIYNAERVLEMLANFILQAPDQWAMYFPVWE